MLAIRYAENGRTRTLTLTRHNDEAWRVTLTERNPALSRRSGHGLRTIADTLIATPYADATRAAIDVVDVLSDSDHAAWNDSAKRIAQRIRYTYA
jgi:hypothetical protein